MRKVFISVLVAFFFCVPLVKSSDLPVVLSDFPSSLKTSWDDLFPRDNVIELAREHQPSWFPRESCLKVWSRRQNAGAPYRYDYSKYTVERYLEDPELIRKHGCEKETAEETRRCLLDKPYQDYYANLMDSLNFDTKFFQNFFEEHQDYFGEKRTIDRKDCYKEWTVLIAMDASTDLMDESLWDLYEMETGFEKGDWAGSTIGKDILVQHEGLDSSGNEDPRVRRIQIFETEQSHEVIIENCFKYEFPEGVNCNDTADWSEEDLSKLPKKTVDTIQSPVVQLMEPEFKTTRSKQERFVDFIKWGMRDYPAKHYMVILWGHGKGWGDENRKGSLHLTGFELSHSLRKIVEDEDGLQGKRPIDNFVADACFMQGVEIATEISPHARYISGSAEVQGFLGLPYRTFFFELEKSLKNFRREKRKKLPEGVQLKDWLVQNGYDEPRMVAEYLPRLMQRYLNNEGTNEAFRGYYARILERAQREALEMGDNPFDFYTYASVDSRALRESLVPALHQLGEAAVPFLSTDNESTKGDEPKNREKWQANLKDSGENPLFRSSEKTVELGSSIEKIRAFAEEKELPEIETAAEGVIQALDQTVLNATFAKRYREQVPGFKAMGVWLPDSSLRYKGFFGFGKGHKVFDPTLFFRFGVEQTSEKAPEGVFSGWHRMLRASVNLED